MHLLIIISAHYHWHNPFSPVAYMKYIFLIVGFLTLGCNTSSTEKARETDSAKVDGTRLVDTLPVADSVPPHVQNPQPD